MFIMLFPYMWNPFKNILMTFETFLMMSITTERYLAIKNPLEYRLGKVVLVKIMIVWSQLCSNPTFRPFLVALILFHPLHNLFSMVTNCEL